MIGYSMDGAANRYLIAQRGDLAGLAIDEQKWRAAWAAEIEKTIGQLCIAPAHLLDLGSGLSPTGLELTRRFGTYCTLVDSESPPDRINRKHNVPFCDRAVVEKFWADNNASANMQYLSPEQLGGFHGGFDAVISLRSWCFHYSPDVYLWFVLEHLANPAVVLIDIRKTHPDWFEALARAWPRWTVVEEGDKYKRIRFEVGGGHG